jgi:methyl halide transferase
MTSVKNTQQENNYWSTRYENQLTGWDLGAPSTPLQTYIDQLKDKDLRILIPGAGNAYEAEYLFDLGFKNVFVLDISDIPLQNFKERNPHLLEQTFFCSFLPTKTNRKLYGKKMAAMLKPHGKLVGVWFEIPLIKNTDKRPFGGNRTEYEIYLSPYFHIKTFELCHNSIKPRAGQEVFGIFIKK